MKTKKNRFWLAEKSSDKLFSEKRKDSRHRKRKMTSSTNSNNDYDDLPSVFLDLEIPYSNALSKKARTSRQISLIVLMRDENFKLSRKNVTDLERESFKLYSEMSVDRREKELEDLRKQLHYPTMS